MTSAPPWTPSAADTPFQRLGGEDAVRALVREFYLAMERDEPALARLHTLDAEGHVDPVFQERFALFLVGWLGGPQDYTARHGHPRLRLRHGAVRVDEAMRDAWLRAMRTALDARGVAGEVRAFLDARFADVADFLRNA